MKARHGNYLGDCLCEIAYSNLDQNYLTQMKQLAFLMKSLGARGAIIHSRTPTLMAHSSAGALNLKTPESGRIHAQGGGIVHKMEAIVICLKIAARTDILISFPPQV